MAAPAVAAAAGGAAGGSSGASGLMMGLSVLQGLGGASGGSNQMGSGIGAKILGAPGDPAGAIYQMVRARKADKESKRRFDESLKLEKERFDLQKMLGGLNANLLRDQYFQQLEQRDWKRRFRNLMVGRG